MTDNIGVIDGLLPINKCCDLYTKVDYGAILSYLRNSDTAMEYIGKLCFIAKGVSTIGILAALPAMKNSWFGLRVHND